MNNKPNQKIKFQFINIHLFFLLSVVSFQAFGQKMESYPIEIDEYRRDTSFYYSGVDSNRGLLNVDNVNYEWNDNTKDSHIITAIASNTTWGGFWYTLKGNNDDNLTRDFNAVFTEPILQDYQGSIDSVAITIENVDLAVSNDNLNFRVEFKDTSGIPLHIVSFANIAADVFPKRYVADISGITERVHEIVVVFDQLEQGDEIEIERLHLIASVPSLPSTAHQAFLWSFSNLLENLDTTTWMVKDKGHEPLHAFEGVTATAKLAKICYYAYQLGFLSEEDAEYIITNIVDNFLDVIPSGPANLLPHFTRFGGAEIVSGEEWSSVDSSIGLLDLLLVLEMIDDPQDQKSGIQSRVEAIAWDEFMINGYIGHGYDSTQNLITYYWADFGMETIAVIWAFAAATGTTTDMNPPPSYGSGFIDHGYFPVPLSQVDIWENDWAPYRQERADIQITWYADQTINLYLAGSSLFGLSAAESPDDLVYEPYRIQGTTDDEDGDTQVIVPHLHAMIADIRGDESLKMWKILRDRPDTVIADLKNVILVSPWNMTESFLVDKNNGKVLHNTLKSSWNLALQTEGWAAYFDHIRENLEEALNNSDFLKGGLDLITNIPPIGASNGISVRVYPNPIINNINIEIEGENNYDLEVEILDINGRIVFRKNIEQEEKSILIEEKFLQNGVFVLILKSNGEIIFREEIIKLK